MFSVASLEVLTCPNSSRHLIYRAETNEFCDANVLYRYPVIGGIPWIFPDVAACLWQWKASLTQQLSSYQHEEDQFKDALKSATSQLLKQRLQRLREARMQDRRTLSNLLKPLLSEPLPPVELARTLASKVPLTQSLTGYYSNLHRDWAWSGLVEPDRDENALSKHIVLEAISHAQRASDNAEPKYCAVFGAGSCRLAYDLHQSFKQTETFAVDINPLLLSVAKRVMEGAKLELNEYPIAPVSLKNVAVQRVLEAPEKVRSGFHFVHADALHPPFKNGSLDLVVTPWFIDIVRESPQNLLRRINACLMMGGVWVNFGTLVFHAPNFADRLSYEEFLECVHEAGFEIVHNAFNAIPYMASPASAHSRVEKILSLAARKIREVAVPEKFQLLPEWAKDNSLAVPLLPAFANFFVEHRTYAQIFSVVDGKRSVSDISVLLANMFGIQVQEARESFLKIAVTLYEKQGSAFIL